MGPVKYFSVEQIKALRVEVDALIQKVNAQDKAGADEGVDIKDYELYGMAEQGVIVKLIEAKMWLGKMLEGRGTEFPAEFADKATTPTA